MQWLQDLMVRLRPTWFFGVSAALGLVVIASAAVGAGTLMEDVTDGDGVAALDLPVASFVAGGPVVLGAVTVAVGVVLGII